MYDGDDDKILVNKKTWRIYIYIYVYIYIYIYLYYIYDIYVYTNPVNTIAVHPWQNSCRDAKRGPLTLKKIN